jgi:hypothetical protein
VGVKRQQPAANWGGLSLLVVVLGLNLLLLLNDRLRSLGGARRHGPEF